MTPLLYSDARRLIPQWLRMLTPEPQGPALVTAGRRLVRIVFQEFQERRGLPPLVAGRREQVPPALQGALGKITLPDPLTVDLLGMIHERVQMATGKRGVVFTPPELALAISETLVAQFPQDVPLRILDPAAGSGTFLLAMRKVLGKRNAGAAIYGIDRDADAVEVLRMNLALSPPCRQDIVCQVVEGDSLLSGLSGVAGIPDALDVIFGNPPFVGEEDHKEMFREVRKGPLGGYYESRMDYACFFVHLGIDRLASGGHLAFILPSSLLTAQGARRLNLRIAKETTVREVRHFGSLPVFLTAPGLQSMVLFLSKGYPKTTVQPTVFEIASSEATTRPRKHPKRQEILSFSPALWRAHQGPAPQDLVDERGTLRLFSYDTQACCTRMAQRSTPLATFAHVDTGVQAGPNAVTAKALRRLCAAALQKGLYGPPLRHGEGVFVLNQVEIAALNLEPEAAFLLRPFRLAREIHRFGVSPSTTHELLYLTQKTCPDLSAHPNLERHLRRYQAILEMRRETQRGVRAYYHLHWPREESIFLGPKLLGVRQTPHPCFAYSGESCFVDLSVNVLRLKDANQGLTLHALLSLLNSTLAHGWFFHQGKRKGELLQIDGEPLSVFPVPPLSPQEIQLLHQAGQELAALHQAQAPNKAAILSWERQVDELVCGAYGLSLPELDGFLRPLPRKP